MTDLLILSLALRAFDRMLTLRHIRGAHYTYPFTGRWWFRRV